MTRIDYALQAVTLEAALPPISRNIFCLAHSVCKLMPEHGVLLSDHRESLERGTEQDLIPTRLRDVVATLEECAPCATRTDRPSNNVTKCSREEGDAWKLY